MTSERFKELVELKSNIDKTTVIVERLTNADKLLIKIPSVDDLVELDKETVQHLTEHLKNRLSDWNDTFESIDI